MPRSELFCSWESNDDLIERLFVDRMTDAFQKRVEDENHQLIFLGVYLYLAQASITSEDNCLLPKDNRQHLESRSIYIGPNSLFEHEICNFSIVTFGSDSGN